MPGYPYFVLGYKSLSANATGAVTWEAGSNERLTIYRIRIYSTGSFDITDIEDQTGTPYTDASSTKPLDSNLVKFVTANAFPTEIELPQPIVLDPSTTLTFTVKDTSGSTNEIWILGIGVREVVA